MASQSNPTKESVREFVRSVGNNVIPLNSRISYLAAMPLAEDELHELLERPASALPPRLLETLPPIFIVLAPYLESANGNEDWLISYTEPPASKRRVAGRLDLEDKVVLSFDTQNHDPAQYHYTFFHTVAEVAADWAPEELKQRYQELLADELNKRIHGEVDEKSWKLKEPLIKRRSKVRLSTQGFQKYARQSLIDTLTLYLHGICCDIEVEPGPRQLPSRFIRRRLELLREFYPPPAGYAVFPEELSELDVDEAPSH